MRHEHLRKRGLIVKHANDARFPQSHDRAFCHRPDGRDPTCLSGQAPLTAELPCSKNCDDRLLPLVGNDGNLDLALLDIEDGIRGIALREDNLILAILGYGSSLADFGEKGLGIECWSSFFGHNRASGLRRQFVSKTITPPRWSWSPPL